MTGRNAAFALGLAVGIMPIALFTPASQAVAQAQAQVPAQVQAQAQAPASVEVPLPPAAGVDLRRMHYASLAAAKAEFKVPLPPPAELAVRPSDLAEFSPVARALRAQSDRAVAELAPERRRGRRTVRFNPDRERVLGIRSFYEKRHFVPLWISNGEWTPAARSVLTRLQRAQEDALELGFKLPETAGPGASDPKALAAADLHLSRLVVRYAQFARGGRINPLQISSLITADRDIPQAAEVLAKLATAEFAGDALFSYNPTHAGYAMLRAKLAEIRGSTEEHPPIAHGKTLRVGMRDERVPLIRLRFGLSTAGDEKDDTLYDTRVAGAIARFQRSRGLRPHGILTKATIAALSQNNRSRVVNEIIANMELWRWVPQNFGDTHIIVNIPEYRVRMIKNGREIHAARVIVGKPKTPTPVFSDVMETVVVNPSWHVPQSIIKKEMLPAYERDASYFSRRGYEVRNVGNRLVVRQPPGPRNALGYVKLLFPNRHAVYMHDTPSRGFFSANRRAFSHGCVRVQDPFKLAGLVLEGQNGWSERRLRRMIGGREQGIRLVHKIPVHIVYFTAQVDESGELRLLGDIYGHSARLRRAMGLKG